MAKPFSPQFVIARQAVNGMKCAQIPLHEISAVRKKLPGRTP
jgi:hypothetical protein